MMPSADYEFQRVMFARIRAQLTSDGLSATVTASPAVDESMPFIQIGESSLSDHTIGHEIETTVHVWSKVRGPHQAKLLQQVVRSALHDTQTITAFPHFRFTCVREEYTSLFIDRDGEHWHGIQRYRALASPAPSIDETDALVTDEADAIALDFTDDSFV